MITISDQSKRMLHASDVQGPVTRYSKDYIFYQKPDFLIMDGSPTIFRSWKFSLNNQEDASNNLVEIIETFYCDIILDHHLRDSKYKRDFSWPYQIDGSKVKTFAEYLGEEDNTPEAH